MSTIPGDAFGDFVTELADGKKWALLRAEGWEDFVERLSLLIADLEPKRRQALVMLLFVLLDGALTPEQAQEWLDDHDLEDPAAVDQLITWLRQYRPSGS